MKSLVQAVKFLCSFAILGLNPTAYSAPSIPNELRESSLIYCTNASSFSLNPQQADMGANVNVVTEQLYDKLFELDPKTNQLKPMLVEHYNVSADGLTITLHLRKNVSFHNTRWFTPTRKFNAEDVIFSLNRMMGIVGDLPALNRESSESGKFHLAQAMAYRTKANLAHYPYFESIALKQKIAQIKDISTHTVQITLTEPDQALLSHLASQYAVILSKEYALQLNADENLPQLDLLPVGTGPYQLASLTQSDYIRLQPHPKYWGKKAHIENMVVDFSSDGTGRLAKFLNNECDVVAFPEPSQLSQIPTEQRIENDGANLAFLAFNMQSSVMQNITLRQAIAQAVDRHRLVSRLFFGTAHVADQVLPEVLWQDPYGKVPFDYATSHAQPSLQKPLKFWVVDEKRVFNLHPMKMAEILRFDLAQKGIPTTLIPVNRAYIAQQLANGKADYDLILTGWLANNADLNGFLKPILSCDAKRDVTNLANWCNPYFDLLLNLAKTTSSKATQNMLYHLSQSILQQELPILPLVNAKRLLLVNPQVSNMAINSMGQVKLSEIRLKKHQK